MERHRMEKWPFTYWLGSDKVVPKTVCHRVWMFTLYCLAFFWLVLSILPLSFSHTSHGESFGLKLYTCKTTRAKIQLLASQKHIYMYSQKFLLTMTRNLAKFHHCSAVKFLIWEVNVVPSWQCYGGDDIYMSVKKCPMRAGFDIVLHLVSNAKVIYFVTTYS